VEPVGGRAVVADRDAGAVSGAVHYVGDADAADRRVVGQYGDADGNAGRGRGGVGVGHRPDYVDRDRGGVARLAAGRGRVREAVGAVVAQGGSVDQKIVGGVAGGAVVVERHRAVAGGERERAGVGDADGTGGRIVGQHVDALGDAGGGGGGVRVGDGGTDEGD